MEPISEKTSISEHDGVLMSWEFSDRPNYRRGRIWYVFMILAGLGLLLYALFSANFLFALIIVMFALVMYVSTIFEPTRMRFALTEDGLKIGESFIPYRDVDKFWFCYEPPVVKNLYLEFRSSLRPRLRIDLDDQNPNKVRESLAKYVREDLDQVDEPLSELIGRILKI